MKHGFPMGGFFQQGDAKNPSILGAGSIAGGKYESVTIKGAGTIDGDVETGTLDCNGSAKIAGGVKAKQFSAKGSCQVAGALDAKDVDLAGANSVQGHIKTGSFQATGAFSVGKDVDAERFSAAGGFSIGGHIKAADIAIRLEGRATAREITGKTIAVTLGSSSSSSSVAVGGSASANAFAAGGVAIGGVAIGGSARGGSVTTSGEEKMLEVASITGDTVTLEGTHAKLVKGKRVTIGPECTIDRVEYTTSLDVDAKATVRERIKK